MKKLNYRLLFTLLIEINSTFLALKQLQNTVSQLKTLSFINLSEIGAASNGIFDFGDVKNKILQWKTQKLTQLCPSNGSQLQNLLNLVCSTAQPTNVTLRDGCITCFSRVTSMPEGPQELNALSVCAVQYFANTTYANCATALMIFYNPYMFVKLELNSSVSSSKKLLNNNIKFVTLYIMSVSQALSTSALNVQPSGCYMGYCDFVRCLRRINSMNLITQCTREARTGVNITLDSDNVRFFTNVTSCILAKTRCGPFNPVTGEPQTPGYTSSGVRISNALQFSSTGELRILAFSSTTRITSSFCSMSSNLTQSSWLTNVC